VSASSALVLRNPGSAPLGDLDVLAADEFRSRVIEEVAAGARISALFGLEPWQRTRGAQPVALVAVIARDAPGELALYATEVQGAYDSLTPALSQAHRFEREIAEQWNVRPEGHPWLKPVRFALPHRVAAGGVPAEVPVIGHVDYFRVEGAEIHEVAVGPVHAGVIEPGHFRFQCHGEKVFHLEISLGYQHRGVERALAGGPDKRSIHYAETLAGDTTIGHATAYAQVVEALAGVEPPVRAEIVRAIALELERARG